MCFRTKQNKTSGWTSYMKCELSDLCIYLFLLFYKILVYNTIFVLYSRKAMSCIMKNNTRYPAALFLYFYQILPRVKTKHDLKYRLWNLTWQMNLCSEEKVWWKLCCILLFGSESKHQGIQVSLQGVWALLTSLHKFLKSNISTLAC